MVSRWMIKMKERSSTVEDLTYWRCVSSILRVKSSKVSAIRYYERVVAIKSFIALYGRILCLSLVNHSRLKSNSSFTVAHQTWCV